MTIPHYEPQYLGEQKYRLESAPVRLMADSAVAMSEILRLIASGEATTKPALAHETGLSPATVTGHLDRLRYHGVLAPGGETARAGRGRPASTFVIREEVGIVIGASITASRLEIAAVTLGQRCLVFETHPIKIADGPVAVLGLLTRQISQMIASLPAARVLLISLGLPGPVDSHHGVPVRPPIMPGWDGHPVAAELSAEFGCPTIVDNDVNLMALGESRALPESELPLLYLKVGTGVGGGLVTANGQLHRGAHGAAGDIGHIRVPIDGQQICSCGNVNCLEAVASIAAMTRTMRKEAGDDTLTQEEFVSAVHAGLPQARRVVRLSAVILGEAVASLVHLYNPARICIGGPLAGASDDLLAGLRSIVYQRALPLATRNLTLAHSVLGREAAIVGASVAAIDTVLSPRYIRDHWLNPKPIASK